MRLRRACRRRQRSACSLPIHQPPDIVTYDVAKPDQIKQPTAVNDDILKGKKLGDVKEMYMSPTA